MDRATRILSHKLERWGYRFIKHGYGGRPWHATCQGVVVGFTKHTSPTFDEWGKLVAAHDHEVYFCQTKTALVQGLSKDLGLTAGGNE